MNYGVIDLGSNSVRLVIYKQTQDRLKIIYNRRESVGLIAYINKDNELTIEGKELLLKTLRKLSVESTNFKLNYFYVLGTEALRQAKNKNEVLSFLKNNLGLEITILSEKEEAFYGAYAILNEFNTKQGFIADLGGGSTEVSFIYEGKIDYYFTLKLGSLSAYLKFIKHIIPNEAEIMMLKNHIRLSLKEIKKQNKEINLLYGVGGSFKALKKLIIEYFDESIDAFSLNDVKTLLSRILYDYEKEYLNLVRIIPERVHTMIPSLVIIIEICEYLGVNLISVGIQGLREGFILHKIKN
ncbi:hypothetical protein [Acholeplasma hippikon]|uniref:Guanosine-5'-triphosphate,3'-diphosphate pyrophosphatase n=1 Tax=Acholeplasma hippikon TaxID=264636 RepID=A0A449BLB7_9MOLU|nr:hypothetical protein [Acholeplasma hippikon]VEU83225.1 Guanosine-5'-triphosphate,3'-diphosphate pyrophosphatase [Acholeplasma hippikon]